MAGSSDRHPDRDDADASDDELPRTPGVQGWTPEEVWARILRLDRLIGNRSRASTAAESVAHAVCLGTANLFHAGHGSLCHFPDGWSKFSAAC
ncbi:hypothetical protein D3C74_410420 [compost metagenome]